MYKNNDVEQLLIGLRKHLSIAHDTTAKKDTRIQSLKNVGEVLEFVLENIDDAAPKEAREIMEKFFFHLLTKVKKSLVSIHTKPETFEEEIGFLAMISKL
jgi:uncharacterized protein YaaN involved in tellurite resistance